MAMNEEMISIPKSMLADIVKFTEAQHSKLTETLELTVKLRNELKKAVIENRKLREQVDAANGRADAWPLKLKSLVPMLKSVARSLAFQTMQTKLLAQDARHKGKLLCAFKNHYQVMNKRLDFLERVYNMHTEVTGTLKNVVEQTHGEKMQYVTARLEESMQKYEKLRAEFKSLEEKVGGLTHQLMGPITDADFDGEYLLPIGELGNPILLDDDSPGFEYSGFNQTMENSYVAKVNSACNVVSQMLYSSQPSRKKSKQAFGESAKR